MTGNFVKTTLFRKYSKVVHGKKIKHENIHYLLYPLARNKKIKICYNFKWK